LKTGIFEQKKKAGTDTKKTGTCFNRGGDHWNDGDEDGGDDVDDGEHQVHLHPITHLNNGELAGQHTRN
jgi:hypothetical protein